MPAGKPEPGRVELCKPDGVRTSVALVGLRASGKSTIGRWLAELYGYRFVDLDDLTAARLASASCGWEHPGGTGVSPVADNPSRAHARGSEGGDAVPNEPGHPRPVFPSAGEMLRKHGLDRFRQVETEILRSVIDQRAMVLALGGGTPTAPGAADLLRSSSLHIIYLRAQPATLRARLARTDVASRPALTDAGTLDEVDAVFAERDGLYRTLGRTIEVDGLTITQCVRLVDAAVFGSNP